MDRRVESLMRSEVLLYYEGGFTSPKRPYQEELEGQILNLIDDQEDQIKFLALGSLLEEINVTWVHLEKKQTRQQFYTKSLKKLCIQSVETAS
ncbi:hypothetical protein Tco_0655451 [Tanacetum coccineum]|uniref:Uncharacterized protein n=1 Tax=Tanacetum coccineum TaxID=301880 RepID=A0ABQ4X6C3_9ASTR